MRFSEGPLVRFRCHVGHAYTASTLLSGIAESVQPKLWQASRALEELVMLLEHMAAHLEAQGRKEPASASREKARETAVRARALRELTPDRAVLGRELLDAAAGVPVPLDARDLR